MDAGLVLRVAYKIFSAVIFLRYEVDGPNGNGSHAVVMDGNPETKHSVINDERGCEESQSAKHDVSQREEDDFATGANWPISH